MESKIEQRGPAQKGTTIYCEQVLVYIADDQCESLYCTRNTIETIQELDIICILDFYFTTNLIFDKGIHPLVLSLFSCLTAVPTKRRLTRLLREG